MQELFLGKFAEDAYRNALKDRKKSITYDTLCKLALSSSQFTGFLYHLCLKMQLKVQVVTSFK
jgi:hypothetical protein